MLNPISSYCNVHNPGLFCPVKKSFERGYTHEGLRFRAFRSSDRADRHAVHKVQACEQGGNPDRIVLSNPGTITLGKKQMLRGGKSRPRNNVILNMLNYIGVEHAQLHRCRRARRERCTKYLRHLGAGRVCGTDCR